jgi:hypothetical protein
MLLTTCTTWNVLSTAALGEVSPCADGVFGVIVVGGGRVVVDESVTLGPASKFPENPSAIPSIQTAARARHQLRRNRLETFLLTILISFLSFRNF